MVAAHLDTSLAGKKLLLLKKKNISLPFMTHINIQIMFMKLLLLQDKESKNIIKNSENNIEGMFKRHTF